MTEQEQGDGGAGGLDGELVVDFSVRVRVDPARWPGGFGMPESSTEAQQVTAYLFDYLRMAKAVLDSGARLSLTQSPFGPYDPDVSTDPGLPSPELRAEAFRLFRDGVGEWGR